MVHIANRKPKRGKEVGELIVYSMTRIYPYIAGTDIEEVRNRAIQDITEYLKTAKIEKPPSARKYPQAKPVSFITKLKRLFTPNYLD